jgi:hypothetical protein
MDPEVEQYMREKQEKQDYLRIEIVEKGYDMIEFARYLGEKKGKIVVLLKRNNREWDGYR